MLFDIPVYIRHEIEIQKFALLAQYTVTSLSLDNSSVKLLASSENELLCMA